MCELSGKCMCGVVRWHAASDILWAAFCHCEDCRRAASSDYVSWFGVHKESVRWDGARTFYQSPPGVMRSFCSACGAAMSFETEVLPQETHLYAATLGDPDVYRPTAHIYWSERLPWVEGIDGLDKHDKGL